MPAPMRLAELPLFGATVTPAPFSEAPAPPLLRRTVMRAYSVVRLLRS